MRVHKRFRVLEALGGHAACLGELAPHDVGLKAYVAAVYHKHSHKDCCREYIHKPVQRAFHSVAYVCHLLRHIAAAYMEYVVDRTVDSLLRNRRCRRRAAQYLYWLVGNLHSLIFAAFHVEIHQGNPGYGIVAHFLRNYGIFSAVCSGHIGAAADERGIDLGLGGIRINPCRELYCRRCKEFYVAASFYGVGIGRGFVSPHKFGIERCFHREMTHGAGKSCGLRRGQLFNCERGGIRRCGHSHFDRTCRAEEAVVHLFVLHYCHIVLT